MLSATQPFSLSPRLVRKLVHWFFIALILVLSLWTWMNFTLGSHLAYDYFRPQVVAQRPLIHMITQGAAALVPEAAEQQMTKNLIAMRDSALAQTILRLKFQDPTNYTNMIMVRISDARIFYTSMQLFVVYITLCMFVWMLYKLALTVFPQSSAYALIAPVLSLIMISTFAVNYGYTYDFAELFFSCAFLYALYKERFALYLFLVALATVNKETTIFGIFFFAVWFFGRMPQRKYIFLLAAQLLVFAVVRITIIESYTGPPGPDFGYLPVLVSQLTSFYRYDYQHVMTLLLSLLFVMYRWPEKPIFLRYALWMFAPNLAAYLLISYTYEYRNFYWSMPPALLLATHSFISLTGIAHLPVFTRKPVAGQGKEAEILP